MEKLKLEHLAPYLPYNLKCYVQGEGNKEFKMVGLDTDFVEYYERGRTVTEDCYIEDCFPILRPLSDLTKNEFNNSFQLVDSFDTFYYNVAKTIKMFPHGTFYNVEWVYLLEFNYVITELYKHHFDVFGLIEKDLAIDINTIK